MAMLSARGSGEPNSFLKDAKVGSSRGFVHVAGSIVAIPHKTGVRPGSTTPRLKFSARSEHHNSFRETAHCYASMDAKPLGVYDPGALRSRLAVDDALIPYKNASTIEFKAQDMCEKRRFVTTHQNEFIGREADLRCNKRIIAHDTAFHRLMKEK
mmetsp:Transcript_82834/g.208644  ORF Transcript_82834/g.208644 Transcript_82834/m.208644 type:complete len:155 (+) Transcript_82834:55-519(+)